MNKVFVSGFLQVTLVAAASAEISYSCDVESYSRGGWVPPELFLTVDESTDTATVSDRLIKYMHKKPIPADFIKLDESRYRFEWTLKNVPIQARQSGIVTYAAGLNTTSNRVRVDATLRGYDNDIRGQGKCRIVVRKQFAD